MELTTFKTSGVGIRSLGGKKAVNKFLGQQAAKTARAGSGGKAKAGGGKQKEAKPGLLQRVYNATARAITGR